MTPTARTAVPHGVRECVESHTSASVDPNVLAIVPRVDARHWAKKTAAARERVGREEWIEAQRRAQELARQHAADLTAQQQWDFAEALHQRLMMPMATINYDMLPHLVNPIMATAYPSYPAVGYRPSVPQVASISEMHPLRHNHQATPGQVAGPPAPMPTYAALHWNNRYVSSLEREQDNQLNSYSHHSLTLFLSPQAELLAYRQQHGNCNVPQSYKENTALGNWVDSQRKDYKKYKRGSKSYMTEERIAKLEKVGFAWSLVAKPGTQWDARYVSSMDLELITSSTHTRITL